MEMPIDLSMDTEFCTAMLCHMWVLQAGAKMAGLCWYLATVRGQRPQK